MKPQKEAYRVIFLNQVTGPLFRELAEDVARALGSCLLITGKDKLYQAPREDAVCVSMAPAYDRRNAWRRFSSWVMYFFVAFHRVFCVDKNALLLIVSNPPFLSVLGYLCSILRGQRYAVLVYDLYPGLLEGVGKIKKGGLLARLWTRFNRITWSRAETLFTIGEYMAQNIQGLMINVPNRPKIISIPNWADGTQIKPRTKDDNWFAASHQQTEKLTVMYSGNIGGTHDLSALLKAAHQLEDDDAIHFLIVGGGVRWVALKEEAAQMRNVTVLPFQPEEHLPFTLTTADVSIVTLKAGVEGHSVPSKTYYALAAGAALIVISQGPNELTKLVDEEQCGVHVAHHEMETIVRAVKRFRDDPVFLQQCRQNSRIAMERHYSRANTQHYTSVIEAILAPMVVSKT
jgi:glycosyltransferase involved in cell wall biosynthesis